MSTLEAIEFFSGELIVQWRLADTQPAAGIIPRVSFVAVRGGDHLESLEGGSVVVRPPPGHRLRVVVLGTMEQVADYMTTRLVPSDTRCSLHILSIEARVVIGNVLGSHRAAVHHEHVPENVIPGWVSYVIDSRNTELVPESPPLVPLVRQDVAPAQQLQDMIQAIPDAPQNAEEKEQKEEKEEKEEKEASVQPVTWALVDDASSSSSSSSAVAAVPESYALFFSECAVCSEPAFVFDLHCSAANAVCEGCALKACIARRCPFCRSYIESYTNAEGQRIDVEEIDQDEIPVQGAYVAPPQNEDEDSDDSTVPFQGQEDEEDDDEPLIIEVRRRRRRRRHAEEEAEAAVDPDFVPPRRRRRQEEEDEDAEPRSQRRQRR